MTKSEKIRLVYGCFLGVFTVVLGALFIFEAADLYYGGAAELGAVTGMYSRAEVGARLKLLLAPAVVWILLVVGGAVVGELFPAGPDKRRSDPVAVSRKLKKRVRRISEGENAELYAHYAARERIAAAVRIVVFAFVLYAAVVTTLHVFDASFFPGVSVNGEVLALLKEILPWVCSAFVALVAETAFEYFYAKKTLPAVKRLVAAGKGIPAEPSSFARGRARAAAILGHRYTRLVLRAALFTVGAVFLLGGILNGEARVTWVKAINICTECIGLG